MRLQITSPADNERGPRYMEKALAAIHQANPHRQEFSLIFGSRQGQIGLFVSCSAGTRDSIVGPLIANYPQCTIAEVNHADAENDLESWGIDLELVPELFPLLRHSQFEDQINRNFADPVSSLLRAIRPDHMLTCEVEIFCRPAGHARRHAALRAVHRLEREFFRRHHRLARVYARNITRGHWKWLAWFLGLFASQTPLQSHSTLETSPSRTHDREENLQAASHKMGCHLFETQIRLIVRTTKDRQAVASDRLRIILGALGPLTQAGLATFRASRTNRFTKHVRRPSFLLSHEELATLFHPPTTTSAAEKMAYTELAELEAPAEFHAVIEEGSIVLGRVRFRDDVRPVVLGREDRRRHVYVTGKTGMGKTTLIQNMIVSDMETGRGLCLVDPHGDLAESIINLIPSHRTNDVINFDAGNRDIAIPFNPLACRRSDQIDQVTSGVVSSFKRLYDSWGPRLEDTLRNAVFAAVEQNGNLLTVMRLLGEKAFREQTVMRIRDEIVRSFWLNEFANWSDNYRTEAVAAIQNKIRPFLTNSNIRHIVNHSGKSLDLRQIMDEGKILIVNLSKGRLGEDNSMLLGAFLVTSIQQAAMTRADIPEAERSDFTLFADEFQNFIATSSFASVLSEARKYRLGLVIAHQYLRQLDEETANAVWGNVGSIIAFQVGSYDAEMLANELGKFAGQIKPENLTGLPKYAAYARLLIDGLPSNPFSLETLPPANVVDPTRANVIRTLMARQFSNSSTRDKAFVLAG